MRKKSTRERSGFGGCAKKVVPSSAVSCMLVSSACTLRVCSRMWSSNACVAQYDTSVAPEVSQSRRRSEEQRSGKLSSASSGEVPGWSGAVY